MATSPRPDDPAQQDRAWAGYHPRAMAPAVVLGAAASLLVWTGRWYQAELSELANRVGGLAVFAIAWCVWPALVAVFLYRTITYTYRLTDRALLLDFGFWYAAVPPVWLAEVTEVRAGAGWLRRMLGVGWVEVRTADREVRMTGVRHPGAFAEAIRNAIQQSGAKSQETAKTSLEQATSGQGV